MADYGYYRKKKRDKPRLPWWGIVLRTLDVCMLVGTLLCSAALIFACLAKYIDPSNSVLFAFAGLVLYVVEGIMALYWLMRWKRWAIVTAAVLLLGIGNARLFYNVNIMERHDEEKPLKSELVVMSYNVRQFTYPSDDGRRPVEKIAELVRDNNVDILCVQEFTNVPEYVKPLDSVLADFKHKYFRHYLAKMDDPNAKGFGLAIYSRYPITDRGVVDSGTDIVHSMWADIRIKRDTLRVVNNHLQSTHINGEDVDYISSFRLSGTKGLGQIWKIADKLRDNYILRVPQAKSIARFVASSPWPTVVCGDFNDTPASYVYRTVSRGLKDTFVLKGRGNAGTYNGFFNMFRIDYILASDGIETSHYYPFDVVYSDHNPIAASFYFSHP